MTVEDRFLNYISYPTMSDENSQTSPSSKKQIEFGRALARELTDIGISDAHIDEYGYVYGTLAANADGFMDSIGLIAHMDTSSEASDKDIKPSVIKYTGGDIVLNKEKNIVLTPKEYSSLSSYAGQRIIVTDGSTLLGADDKAGIAEIVTALENIIIRGYPHGRVKIAFTPDEEIGRGTQFFNMEEFDADYAYTVDGGALGELEYENFNAASANVKFYGVSIHPGSAKGIMKNASLMALEFNGFLPADEIPSNTEGYEGFHHLQRISGNTDYAELSYIIRDHDRIKFEKKKEIFLSAAKRIQDKYGKQSISIDICDSYYNMRELIEKRIEIVEYAKVAMRKAGVEPIVKPIRGGTDGAKLSYMGLLCPNICTGGENFHSRFEYISVEAMEKTVKIIENIILGAK